MLQDLYDAIDKAIGEGITFGQFKKELPNIAEDWKKGDFLLFTIQIYLLRTAEADTKA